MGAPLQNTQNVRTPIPVYGSGIMFVLRFCRADLRIVTPPSNDVGFVTVAAIGLWLLAGYARWDGGSCCLYCGVCHVADDARTHRALPEAAP